MLSASFQKPSILEVSAPIILGAVWHIGAWILATRTHCHGIGLGAMVCEGGLGLTGAIIAFAAGFLGAPLLVMILLRRAGQPHAGLVAWGAQLIAMTFTILMFRPFFRADTHSAPLLWELVTQLAIVPTFSVLLMTTLRRVR
jgi:hypothetical protein